MVSYKLFLFLFLNLFSFLAFVCGENKNPECLQCKNGSSFKIEFMSEEKMVTVEGWRNASWTGNPYYSFRAIPFAEKPIGELRFKDPQPLKELPSYIDGRYEGYDCYGLFERNQSEDCLTLNIYTRAAYEFANLPVIFYLHGGGWLTESGNSWSVNPTYMLAKNVVLVSINYRLAAQGFLNLGTREVPGNAGMKDQVVALRWVQKYIKHFGGNPNDVTIMGYSVGGSSVGLHLVSPMSQGLFHKAIIMSGAHQMHSPTPKYDQLELLRKQAKALNCEKTEEAADILECMRGASGQQLIDSIQQLYSFGLFNPLILNKPVLEQDFGQERFLIESPLESMRRGEFAKVPILVGFVTGELCALATRIYQDADLKKRFPEEFERIAPILFMYENVIDRNISAITAALKNYYLPNFTTELKEENLNGLCDLFSEAHMRFGDELIAELAAPHTTVFEYRFDFLTDFNSLDFPLKPQRVQHGDDLAHLFGSVNPKFTLTPSAKNTINLYTQFMYNFVKFGALLENQLVTYPNGFTRIDSTLERQTGQTALDKDTYDLWKRLFL